jgi:hypothetical protein
MKYPPGKRYERTCWYSLGVETSNCDIESEARFKGGLEGWRRFLEKNLSRTSRNQKGNGVTFQYDGTAYSKIYRKN